MSGEDCFALWAPDDAAWSEWAKPIPFVQMNVLRVAEPPADEPLPSIPVTVTSPSIAIVDLPGAESVAAGLALAARGFRPVPLFNATQGPAALIDVEPITRALTHGAARLQRLPLARDAAPAFLLDSRRLDPAIVVRPGAYDNRWVALPQDFPSGALLASRGLRRATLLQRGTLAIRPDLAHVLRRWQENGIALRVIDLASGETADNVDVPKPSGFKRAWYVAIALFGLRRSNVGGFGSMVPHHTGGTGIG